MENCKEEKGCYRYFGFVVDKFGLHIRISSIVSFKHDYGFGQTYVMTIAGEHQISDTDRSFYNLLKANC